MTALLELVQERDAGLLVFGPALNRIGRLSLRRGAYAGTQAALVWVVPDG